jgi:hypothetical protein
MRSMFRKGDSSARNWLLELGPDRRSHWGRHGCAFWRVPCLPAMAYGTADLPPSTPHACSTLWPRAGQSIDAGRCWASWSEKKEEVAHRRRRTGAQRLPTYLQLMDCQRPLCGPLAVHRLAGLTIQRSRSSQARAMATSADDGAAGTGACGQILGSHNHTVQGCASAALARVQAAAGRQRWSDISPMVKIIIQCATVACDTPRASSASPCDLLTRCCCCCAAH